MRITLLLAFSLSCLAPAHSALSDSIDLNNKSQSLKLKQRPGKRAILKVTEDGVTSFSDAANQNGWEKASSEIIFVDSPTVTDITLPLPAQNVNITGHTALSTVSTQDGKSAGNSSAGNSSAGRSSAGRSSAGRSSAGRSSVGGSSVGGSSAGNSSVEISSAGSSSVEISSARSSELTTIGRVITHNIAGVNFTWNVSCGGGDCIIGKFIGGDYWISPMNLNDKVVIESVSPIGEQNGLEINPSSSNEQGFLSCQTHSYKAQRNLMTNLPFEVQLSTSLVKAYKSHKKCGTKSIDGCCVGAYDVLTVLKEQPKDEGLNAFRPGFADKAKNIYYADEFDFSNIPHKYSFYDLDVKPTYEEIQQRWYPAYVDHFMSDLGDRGRAFSPNLLIHDYGATQGAQYLGDLLYIMNTSSSENKFPAIVGLLQRGIDLYSSWGQGIKWHAGAGQQMGRKPPIVFFGSLVKDRAIKKDIMAISKYDGDDTQEDGQIYLSQQGVPIWGDRSARYTQCNENNYWSQLFDAKYYDGAPVAPNPKGDNKKTCADPYGWIDGPAGTPGSFYMSCCSTGGFIAYTVAMNSMPELCKINNDPELTEYVSRITSSGLHTLPDPCAPPDPKESESCKPYKNGLGCKYYKKTWGPDPNKPGSCIVNGTGGKTQFGRFPHLHGAPLTAIYNEPSISQYLRGKYGKTILDSCKY